VIRTARTSVFHCDMVWPSWFLNDRCAARARTTVPVRAFLVASVVAALPFCAPADADAPDAREVVARLDTEFQAAVKVNDVEAMERILGENMILVLGNGAANTRTELLQEARDKAYVYERQEEDFGTQTVRVWGDTAVVTARLWVKGTSQGKTFDRHLWFSDVYIRTPRGWRYVFGQASLHLPDEPTKS
jgi:ketosteroid isomerase-like protein